MRVKPVKRGDPMPPGGIFSRPGRNGVLFFRGFVAKVRKFVFPLKSETAPKTAAKGRERGNDSFHPINIVGLRGLKREQATQIPRILNGHMKVDARGQQAGVACGRADLAQCPPAG